MEKERLKEIRKRKQWEATVHIYADDIEKARDILEGDISGYCPEVDYTEIRPLR